MLEIAVTYAVVAWLATWAIDLIIIVARGPVIIDPIAKLIVVLICLFVVLFKLAEHHWLW